jgi:hypothetical protein
MELLCLVVSVSKCFPVNCESFMSKLKLISYITRIDVYPMDKTIILNVSEN